MNRLFEMKTREGPREVEILIDLEKVCTVRVERHPGNYPVVLLRFAGGQEIQGAVPDKAVDQFLAAYRAHLSGKG
ncbi:MAG TPA: hypothetical protein VKE74_28485 [Gemmataceae bacterium]|nr:hypothetical protein [Gemmataceae bacterium]